jgi:hypothetical protein
VLNTITLTLVFNSLKYDFLVLSRTMSDLVDKNAGRKFLKISNVKTSKIRFAIKIQNLGFGPILPPIVLVIAI